MGSCLYRHSHSNGISNHIYISSDDVTMTKYSNKNADNCGFGSNKIIMEYKMKMIEDCIKCPRKSCKVRKAILKAKESK